MDQEASDTSELSRAAGWQNSRDSLILRVVHHRDQ